MAWGLCPTKKVFEGHTRTHTDRGCAIAEGCDASPTVASYPLTSQVTVSGRRNILSSKQQQKNNSKTKNTATKTEMTNVRAKTKQRKKNFYRQVGQRQPKSTGKRRICLSVLTYLFFSSSSPEVQGGEGWLSDSLVSRRGRVCTVFT